MLKRGRNLMKLGGSSFWISHRYLYARQAATLHLLSGPSLIKPMLPVNVVVVSLFLAAHAFHSDPYHERYSHRHLWADLSDFALTKISKISTYYDNPASMYL